LVAVTAPKFRRGSSSQCLGLVLADYIAQSGPDAPNPEIEIGLNGDKTEGFAVLSIGETMAIFASWPIKLDFDSDRIDPRSMFDRAPGYLTTALIPGHVLAALRNSISAPITRTRNRDAA
jgi:hypothetical protein